MYEEVRWSSYSFSLYSQQYCINLRFRCCFLVTPIPQTRCTKIKPIRRGDDEFLYLYKISV